MSFKNKINMILALTFFLCVGTYLIIDIVFGKLENQLLDKCNIEAKIGARFMGETLSLLVDSGLISEKDMFDENYVKIPGTSPQKFSTRFDKILDAHIQGVQDEFLGDPDVDYAVLIDRNGYLPTHNTKYSQAETSDREHNIKYSRSKRNFSNHPAIKQSVEYRGKGVIRLFYHRDTGEKMWNLAAPVSVNGRHWGSFLLGVSLSRLNIIQNQMLILVVTTLVVIISLSMLTMLAVTPRRIFFPPKEGEKPDDRFI